MKLNSTSINIIYKNPQEFLGLVKSSDAKEFGVYPHYKFKDKKTLTESGFSQFAKTCSIVLINDEGIHLAPELRESSLLKNISELAKKVKDTTGILTSFIFGGEAHNQNKDSFELFNDIGNVLDKEGADISVICGKKFDGSRDALLKDKNNIFITSESNEDLALTLKNNQLSKEQVEEAFSKYYEVVDISPNHNLCNKK